MKTIGRTFLLLTIWLGSLFAFVTVTYASIINVSSYGDGTCSLANAQSAYNAASAGDIIVFPAGNCTWSSSLTIGKPISIIGAGSGPGGTKLIASGSMSNGFFNVTGITSSSLLRISGFYFEMKDWTPETAIYVHNVTMDNIRIDQNTFNQGSKPILFYNPKGLIDNNYFYNANIAIEYSAGTEDKAKNSWVSMAAGTGNALFIEDNHFIDDANFSARYVNERIGTFNGGKLVARYNHFDSVAFPLSPNQPNTPIMTHGSAAGGVANAYWQEGTGARRGQSVVEVYNNIFIGKRIDYPVAVRGSANLIYNNQVTITPPNNPPRIAFGEEEYFVTGQWVPLRINWPAEDQIHNTFIWNNTYNGNLYFNRPEHIVIQPQNGNCTGNRTPMSCCTGSGTGTCGDGTGQTNNQFIQLNRDYFLHAPCGASDLTDAYGNTCTHGKASFTGLNGGSASYPTDGSTYPTLGNMTFSNIGDNAYYGYTPYQYPHPLRSERRTLGAPLNVRIMY